MRERAFAERCAARRASATAKALEAITDAEEVPEMVCENLEKYEDHTEVLEDTKSTEKNKHQEGAEAVQEIERLTDVSDRLEDKVTSMACDDVENRERWKRGRKSSRRKPRKDSATSYRLFLFDASCCVVCAMSI